MGNKNTQKCVYVYYGWLLSSIEAELTFKEPLNQGLPSVCEFSAFRHFFKPNVAQSVAELIHCKKHEM